MFKGIINKTLNSNTDDIALLINSNLITPTNVAKSIFITLTASKSEDSLWEIYMNPTITSNGTLVTVTTNNSTLPTNKILLYTQPVINTYGIPFRKFILPKSTKEFSTNMPTMQLEPGESMLLRRISKNTGTIKNTWTWEEF